LFILASLQVMDLQDGLPKFLDLPESLGGSGKVAGAQ
jgi:hypothetical protein